MSKEEYYLMVNGKKIKVSKEVYQEYKRTEEKENYFMKRLKKGQFITDLDKQMVNYIPSREESYEKLLELRHEFPSSEESVENIAWKSYLLEQLEVALHTLTDEEMALISELFYLEKSEREVCASLNMAKTTLHYRKNRILEKLRKQIEKN